jgi:hypothetical protein
VRLYGILLLAVGALAVAGFARPATLFRTGETVELHVSKQIWRPCIILRDVASERLVRVRCPAFRVAGLAYGAGDYAVARRRLRKVAIDPRLAPLAPKQPIRSRMQ